MWDPSGQTQRTYDQVAPVYARKNSQAYADLVKDFSAIADDLRRGSVIADIGCGPGRDTAMMRAAGFRAVGLDLSFGQLRAGGLPGHRIGFLTAHVRRRSAGRNWLAIHAKRGK